MKWSISKKIVNAITAGIAASPRAAGTMTNTTSKGDSSSYALRSTPGSIHRGWATEIDQGGEKARSCLSAVSGETLSGRAELFAEILSDGQRESRTAFVRRGNLTGLC